VFDCFGKNILVSFQATKRPGTEPGAVATGLSQRDLPACYRKRFRTIVGASESKEQFLDKAYLLEPSDKLKHLPLI
jgi:hypothetical protein